MNFNHTFCEVGTFTAVLSVPDVLRRNVYWKKQSLKINVKTNIQNEVEELQSEVEDLQSQVKQLRNQLTKVVQGKCLSPPLHLSTVCSPRTAVSAPRLWRAQHVC